MISRYLACPFVRSVTLTWTTACAAVALSCAPDSTGGETSSFRTNVNPQAREGAIITLQSMQDSPDFHPVSFDLRMKAAVRTLMKPGSGRGTGGADPAASDSTRSLAPTGSTASAPFDFEACLPQSDSLKQACQFGEQVVAEGEAIPTDGGGVVYCKDGRIHTARENRTVRDLAVAAGVTNEEIARTRFYFSFPDSPERLPSTETA